MHTATHTASGLYVQTSNIRRQLPMNDMTAAKHAAARAAVAHVTPGMLLGIGSGSTVHALYVQFRDVGHVWEWFSQLLFYGSAVVYPITYIPNHVVQTIIAINPITQVIEDVRYSIVTQSIEPLNHLLGNLYIVPYIFVAISILVGSFVFSRLSSHFAENL